MVTKRQRITLIALAVLLLPFGCVTVRRRVRPDEELRGVWVATVANIDWPSRRDLSTDDQKKELIAILDRAAALHLNAVFFQVRPAADALYSSKIDPWSEYLTGTMGKAPEPYWDPLAFAVAEEHARGLQLHAWFNPFRAHHPTGTSPIAEGHVSRAQPELVRQYGQSLWLDPGQEEARRQAIAVIIDVARRYDVDGVHLDDYFYPYPEKGPDGQDIDFPDDASWTRYRQNGGGLDRDDWRRENVNAFVRDLYAAVKAARPSAKVGISPFGIWRSGRPAQIRGFDAYQKLYADSRLWLRRGWVDYLAPQLYWPIAKKEQSFPALLNWWTEQDEKGRGIVAGISVSRVGGAGPDGWPADEIRRQIEITRRQPGAIGFILFSMRGLMADRGGIDEVLIRTLPPQQRTAGSRRVGPPVAPDW
jgi:uncharacterized lipoprotein YddW (UPF0748 family)